MEEEAGGPITSFLLVLVPDAGYLPVPETHAFSGGLLQTVLSFWFPPVTPSPCPCRATNGNNFSILLALEHCAILFGFPNPDHNF